MPNREFDLIIRGGRLVDGAGNPWQRADVGIRGDRIEVVGRIPASRGAKRILDARGSWVTPGFIDAHTHSDFPLLADGRGLSKLYQGVTTDILGENSSAGPVVGDAAIDEARGMLGRLGLELSWQSLGEYFAELERSGISMNVASYAGAGQLRLCVMGQKPDTATPAELEKMQQLLDEAMRQGAVGLSFGLIYVPGRYASTDELSALAAVASEHGGIVAGHLRSEREGLLESLEEAIQIGRRADAPLEVFHFKAVGPSNWQLQKGAIAKIEAARREGLDVTANAYPYTASHTELDVRFPEWARGDGPQKLVAHLVDSASRARIRTSLAEQAEPYGGEWELGDAILVAELHQPDNARWQGKRISDVARATGKDVYETLMDLVVSEKGGGSACYFMMSDDNVGLVLRQPWVCVGSDGSALCPEGVLGQGCPHPRSYGTFPRLLGEWVRDRGVLTLEEAIRKITSLPATRLGLAHRGLVHPGFYADLAIFDLERVRETAAFADPHHLAEVMRHVIVAGEPVIEDGEHTGQRPGRPLRRGVD